MVAMLSAPIRTQPFGCSAPACEKAFFEKLPKATPMATAPEDTRKARRETPWKTIPSNFPSSPFFIAASRFLRRALDGGDDLVVGAATADIALHVLDDLLAARVLG